MLDSFKMDLKILPGIDSPADLKKLKVPELAALAQEIRGLIIRTVSRNGGHLASSLGSVELTLALHYVFNAPRDRIIWDVGHQAYAHKIITGRRDMFHTLRRRGGVCGFPRREESPFDVFNAGHSSTSISAGTGIAEALCLKKENARVVAVIGDGSMTAGMAFEGLNWAGDRKKNLIIVLNDNEMSISPNVGALSSYLNRIMTGHHVTRIKSEIKSLIKTIPAIGEQLFKITKQIEESMKVLFVPGMLFEELGFKYVGPLEGHKLDSLIKTLSNVKDLNRPVLVHVLTKKGMGYEFAEKEPSRFHGIGPFCLETGENISNHGSPPSYTEVFGRTMVEFAREDERIVAITAAMCQGTGLENFAAEFPQRFFDVGIAEQHGVTFAAGLAVEGLKPVVAIYSTFMQRAYDQVLHDVCLQNLPVVFALDRGGIVGDDGPTHHGLFDYSFLRSIPNLTVMAPKDESELRDMIKTALSLDSPASIRYPRGKGTGASLGEPKLLDIGRAEVLKEGKDMVIFAIGSTVYPALEAARVLEAEGIDAKVINCRFVKPLDEELLAGAALEAKRVLTVEENVLMGGFGTAVLELLETRGAIGVRTVRLGISDQFVEHATQEELRAKFGIDSPGIAAAARRLMKI
jgi:1-deoxy-D-xylulose-5-phosphate synthase